MRITSTGMPDATGTSSVSGSGPVQETSRAEAPASATAAPAQSAGRSGGGPLQAAALQPTLAALKDLPEIDEAKVASIRDALAKGEIKFDAAKLAGLISRYHASGEEGRG